MLHSNQSQMFSNSRADGSNGYRLIQDLMAIHFLTEFYSDWLKQTLTLDLSTQMFEMTHPFILKSIGKCRS